MADRRGTMQYRPAGPPTYGQPGYAQAPQGRPIQPGQPVYGQGYPGLAPVPGGAPGYQNMRQTHIPGYGTANPPSGPPGVAAPVPFAGAMPMAKPGLRATTTNIPGVTKPPMTTGQKPGQPAPVQASRPGYVDLAKPPKREYIPPPPTALKFAFNSADEGKYANLYSILATMDSVQEQAALGFIKGEDKDVLTESLVKQYNTVIRAIGFKLDDVRGFAEAADLSCDYAWHILDQTGKRKDNPHLVHEMMNLGEELVLLSNNLIYESTTVSAIQTSLAKIQGYVKRAQLDPSGQMATRIEQIIIEFNASDPTGRLTERQKATCQNLREDVHSMIAH